MATTVASEPEPLADWPAAGGTVFLDANILIYASFPSLPFFPAARRRLEALEDRGASFAVSRQIFREFLAASTRLGAVEPLPAAQILTGMVEEWESRCAVCEDDAGVTACLLRYLEHPGARGKQVHDANIAATMRRHAILYLLTHNTADFARYAPHVSVLPLIPGGRNSL